MPLRERIRHPGARRQRELRVLEDISFDVRRGEFFGIVGPNGSGKSTLLKILASIYRADGGRVRVAGRLAAFLDLGVGFNPQLAAHENVVLNGVMMGLSLAQARARYERIIEFAGLREYTDLQLKNYSAGMRARLGFAVLTHVDADVLLVDEVLATGDADFAAKCDQTFRRTHEQGRTIVLVTHSMPTVSAYCERAMLVHDGQIAALGEPDEVCNRYIEACAHVTAGSGGAAQTFAARTAEAIADPPIRIVDRWLADADGKRIGTVAAREPIELHAVLEFVRPISAPGLYLRIDDSRGQNLFVRRWADLGVASGTAPSQGERFRVRATVENPLANGRYVLVCGATERRADGTVQPAGPTSALRFEVAGAKTGGTIAPEHEIVAEREALSEVPPR